jgi:hypothetical protein
MIRAHMTAPFNAQGHVDSQAIGLDMELGGFGGFGKVGSFYLSNIVNCTGQ